MTPRRLLALNVVLTAVSAMLAVYIVRQLITPTPLPVGGRRAAPVAATTPMAETPRPPAGAYQVVAARNLFSPTRTEGASSTTTVAVAPLVRPNLFGIVVRDGGSIAYLEDPATKRVVGYRIGDSIVGGTVQTIKADSVVIERPDGPVDVRLRDPGKPRGAQTAGQPGAPQLGSIPAGGPQPVPQLPGVIPPAGPLQPPMPQMAQPRIPQQQPGQMPGVIPPGAQAPVIPPNAQAPVLMPPSGRRPLPPNLLRRVPPGMSDVPRQ